MRTDNISDKKDIFKDKGSKIKKNTNALIEFEFMDDVNVVKVYLTSSGPIQLKAAVEKNTIVLVSLKVLEKI